MGNMKYIRTDNLGIVVFDAAIQHYVMAECLSLANNDIISAGFVTKDMHCIGESISLKKASRPEDTKLLSRQYCG